MRTATDRELAFARTYSRALLVLAEEKKESERVLEELRLIVALLDKDPMFDTYFSSPTVDAKVRERTIDTLFRNRLTDLVVDTLQVMNRKGRSSLVRALAQTFHEDYEEACGIVEVFVWSAVALGDEDRRKASAMAEGYTKKKVVLVERVDPSMLGGLIIQIGDRKFDMSVRSHLRKIGDALIDRASRELHRGVAV